MTELRFFFVKTLRRPYLKLDLPYPKMPKRLPTVLSEEEVARLIDSAKNLPDYTMLMTLYATGMRRAELIGLKVQDIDSQRMIIHIRQGKGNRDRDVPLPPKLLKAPLAGTTSARAPRPGGPSCRKCLRVTRRSTASPMAGTRGCCRARQPSTCP